MKRTKSPFYVRRTFILSLLSFVAVAALVSFGVSARRANRKAALQAGNSKAASLAKPIVTVNAQDQNPNAPDVFGVTATLTDSIAAATKMAPGQTINYTAVITNTSAVPGEDANSVVYNGNLDPNTTISGLVQVSPVTVNDTYPQTVIGNVQVNSANIPYSVVTNDYQGQNGGALSITASNITTAQGGQVVMTTSGPDIGKFTYNPPAGFEGNDTFTYTLINSVGSTTAATVTIPVAGMVWFINNNSAACTTIAAGCGRITNPFSDLGSFNTVNNGTGNNPAVNDNIFIYESATSYNNSVTLLNGQKLIGQDSTSSLSTITGLNPPSGSTAFPAMNSGNGTITKITSGTGNGITLNSVAGSNTINGLTVGNTTGVGISGTSFGTLTVANVSIDEPSATRTGQALSLTTGAVTATFGTVESSSGTNNVSLVSVTGTINLGTGALSGATGNALTISGAGNTATISYAGTITNTTASAVSIASKTGGTVTLSGLITGSGTGANGGISLLTNTGTTMNFTGGINLNMTGSAPGFTATGGGTVSVTDPNAVGTAPDNTLATVTGTALNVANTTIGASNLNFRSISSNGAANGINLSSTGTSGGLTVTGNSSGLCGGQVSNTTVPATAATITAPNPADCTGGTIQSSTGDGIRLNSVVNVSLTRMLIINGGQSGIFGTGVNGFQLISSFVSNNGNNVDEIGLKFTDVINPGTANGLVGTALNGTNPTRIINSTVRQSGEFNVEVVNRTGVLTDLLVDGCQFTDTKLNAGPADADGFNVEMQNTAVATVRLTNSFFSNNFTQGAQLSAIDSANLTATVTSSTFTNNNEGFVCNHSGNSDLTCTVGGDTAAQGNHFEGEPGGAGTDTGALIVASTGSTGTASASLTARIKNNHVTAANNQVNHSIIAFVSGVGTPASINISNNTVNHQVFGHAILVDPPDSAASPQFSVTANNNAVTNNAPGGHGVLVQARQNSTACVLIQNNTGSVAAGSSVARIRQNSAAGQNSTLNLKQGVSASNVATQVMIDNNPGVTTSVAGPTNGAINVVTNAGCTTPTQAPNPISLSNTADETHVADFTEAANGATRDPSLPLAIATSVNPFNGNESMLASNVASSKPFIATQFAKQISLTLGNSSVLAKTTPKASAAEVTRIDGSERVLSHHAKFNRRSIKASRADDQPLAPTFGEAVGPINIGTMQAGKSVTIKYSATVNTTALTARQASHQGTVTYTGGAGSPLLTDDPDAVGTANPTDTQLDTALTWTGATDTNWNTATNWNRPGPAVSSYAPSVGNSAVNDVVIPAVATQPTIGTTDISIYSLNLANAMTLTITNPRVLTIAGAGPGSDLTLNGIISGGFLNFGAGTHAISGAGSLSSTNVATILTGSTVTLNNALQAGAFAVNAGGSFIITNQTLSLNGSGAAFALGGAFTPTGSTVVLNGTAAQTIAGTTYNNLTINNTIGAHVTGVTLTGNATVNGVLTLTSSDLATGAFTLTMPNTATSAPASGASDVVGNVTRTGFASGGIALSFGNPLNTIRINSGTAPTSINVLLAKNAPVTYAAAALRSYTITPTGGTGITATVRLHYRQVDLANPLAPGGAVSETPTGDFNLRRFSGGGWKAVVPTSRNVGVVEDNWLENNVVTTFSEWTFANLAPTASSGVVTGRIVDNDGHPVEGAVVRLEGTQNRKFITDSNGVYRFENVETSGFYTVTPSRANYTFNPASRSFSQLGETTEAVFGATVATSNLVNPLDTPEYFVRQHYLDFLGREPDEAGFNFWSDEIIGCGLDQDCIGRKRENVSAAYFLSIEFQATGGLVDGLYRAGFGVRPAFAQFMPDTRAIAAGVVVGRDGWQAKLQANKEAFVADFVNRPAFHALYDGLENSVFVDTLISHTGVSFTAGERDALVSGLSAGTMTRAEALTAIAENERFVNAKFNDAFVMMEYFGYLRRDADAEGFQYWLNKLNQFGGNFEQAEMVKAFIVSGEYRDRFPK